MKTNMFRLNRIVVLTILLPLFAFAFVWTRTSASEHRAIVLERSSASKSDVVTLNAARRGFPLINLQDGKRLETDFIDSESASGSLATSRPLTMTNADLNLDGAADLVVGYAAADGGHLAIHRGSLDTLSARTPEVFEAMKEGRFPEPFSPEVRIIKTTAAPDFIGTGDFNRDGAIDILTAARNDNRAFLFLGSRAGSHRPAFVELPGRVTAMLTGNIDPMDNVADAAFAISTEYGSSVVVYNDSADAFARTPDTFPLPAPATSLAIGQLDDHDPIDLLAAGGGRVTIVHGEYRGREPARERTEILTQGFDVAAVRVGEFVWDREHRREIALLDSGGTVHILARGSLDRRPFTEDEHRRRPLELRAVMAQEEARRKLDHQPFAPTRAWGKWRRVDSMHVGATNTSAASSTAYFTSARMTPFPVEDLLIVDPAARKINVLIWNNDDLKKTGDSYSLSTSGDRANVTLDLAATPVAALPMRLSVMNRPGIVLLDEASNEISYSLAAPQATFTVTKTADTYDGSCTAADCSFREALQAANAASTSDVVMVPAGTYTISPALGGPDQDTTIDPAAQQSGDWDVFYDTTITGAGQATTILQAAAAQPGHDRVLDAIQTGVGIPDLTISGVTIRNGRCQPSACVDGGGLRYGVDNQSILTISDSTITGNRTEVDTANPANNGGGIFGGQSDFSYTNVTVTNNFTAFVTSGCIGATQCGGEGGGVFSGTSFTANPTSVTMTNCTITGNTVNAVNGLGGRGGAYAGSPNSVTVNGGNFSSNIAFTDAGAFRLFTPTTINGPTTISNNTARQNGGGIWSDPLANDNTPLTNTFSSLTMQGNTADSDGVIGVNNNNRGDGGAIFHGRGTLNLTGSTIGGVGVGQSNTAFDGGGIGRTYAQFVSAIFNASTLNINGGSIVGNLAINNGGGVINDATRTGGGNPSVLNIGATTAVTVTNNNARNHGGGIAVITNAGSIAPTASASLNNMTLRNNTANSDSSGSGDGGAFYQNNNGTAVGTTFTGTLSIGGSGFQNSAVNGGGIGNAAGLLALPTNTSITFNTATANGGGINNGGTINSFTGATISSNTATGNGGGINNSAGALTASGVTMSGNTAANGSAIQAAGGTTTLAGTSSITGNINVAGGTLAGALGSTTNLTGNYSQSSGTFTGNDSIFNITGNFSFTGGTFTGGTGTFNFNGSGVQSIGATSPITFFNLTDSNTAQPLAVNNSINANGTLTVNANTTFAPAAVAVIGGTGTLTGNGIVRVTRATGTNDFLTQYTITNKTLTNLTVDYVGATAQGVSSTTYGNLRINNASGASLSGAVTVGGTLTLQAGNLAVGTSSLTVNGGFVSTGGTFSSAATGTVNYNQSTNGQVILPGSYGNLTFSGFNKDLTGANINIAGTFTPGAGTATTTGSTITFNGAALQTIPVFNYNNLALNNPAGANLGGNVTVGGSLTLTNGPLNVLTNTLTLNGAATQTSGTLTSAATGTVNYNQGSNGQGVLSGSYGNLTFSNFTKDLTNRTISIAGIFAPGTAVGHIITGSTFIYNGAAAQTLPAGFATYNNLTLNNTAGVTGFPGLTANGLLLVQAGTFTSNSSSYNNVQINAGATLAGVNATTINMSGNWTNTGAFTANGNTLNFNGGALQTIGGTSSTTFNNLIINNSNGVNLGANATAGGTLTLTLGALGVGTNTLTLNGAAAATGGSLTSSATGTVNYNQALNGQVVLPASYGNLTFSNFNKDLTNANVGIAGAFSPGTAPGHVATGSTITFNGTAVQSIPVFPYNNLTMNNAAGATLAGNATVSGSLTFTNGVINTGANTLTVGPSGTSTRTSGHVIGNLRKLFNAPGSFDFHVGTGVYSPINQTVTAMTAASGELTVRANDGMPVVMPIGLDPLRTLQLYWTLTGTGIRSNLTFNYDNSDVPGPPNDENLWAIIRVTGNTAVNYPDSLPYVTMSPGTNQFSIDDLESYSHWTAGMPLAPTAANATVAGRITDIHGHGLSGVRILMQDQSGNVVQAITSSFGYYAFTDVQAGQTYLLSPNHKRYAFQSRTINVTDDLTGVDFIAEP